MKVYDKQYINGQWREGTSEKVMENRNPYTGELIYSYRAASTQDIDDAYAAAAAAQPAWEQVPPAEKAALLEKLATVIEEMHDDIAAVLIEEGGSAAPKVGFECGTSATIARQAMAFPYVLKGQIIPSDIPGKENYVYKKPKGVIGVIAPWNVPLVLAMRSVVPAVATGNTVVVKPASDTPASAFLIAEFFERAGFPAGVVNVVAGRGSEIGDYFVEHPVPSLISFTGSTEVGRRIGAVAGGQIKDVSLELGGNNAMVVLADADVERAAAAACFGAFFHQGQVCMALNRIIVEAPAYEVFERAFVAAASQLKAGDPADPTAFMGPIINEGQVASIESYVQQTIDAGARVALEGRTEGNVIQPWILADCTNDMPACCNEVFGPVCCLIKAADEDEAVRIANDTDYGLSGSVFTTDIFHGMEVARRIESGMVHVNDQSINDEPQCMFGGEKCSGVGRFNAQWVVDKFTTEQWVSVQAQPRF